MSNTSVRQTLHESYGEAPDRSHELPPRLSAGQTVEVDDGPPLKKSKTSKSGTKTSKLEADAAVMLSQFQRASKKVSERIEERELASIRLAKQVSNAGGPLKATTAAAAAAAQYQLQVNGGHAVSAATAAAIEAATAAAIAAATAGGAATAALLAPTGMVPGAGILPPPSGIPGPPPSMSAGEYSLATKQPTPPSNTIAVPGWGVALLNGVFSPHILDLDTRDRNTFLKAAGERFAHFDAKSVLVKESRKHKQKSALVKFRAKAEEKAAAKKFTVDTLIAMGAMSSSEGFAQPKHS